MNSKTIFFILQFSKQCIAYIEWLMTNMKTTKENANSKTVYMFDIHIQ